MRKLAVADLMSLERYARERGEFRSRVLAHKRDRRLSVGPNMTWLFEDRLTVQYQVQEMLRVERIFEPQGIEAELESYNPLIPDGRNWKATLLIEFPDEAQRHEALARLRGVEERCWVRVGALPPLFAIADEDLERANEEKTSAVHFLRFELPDALITQLRAGAPCALGVDHPAYRHAIDPLPAATRSALLADLGDLS
ncbi:MAG TPA: DUF3501 family protein [Steroidobacteraceae bacterium]|jgi:hypothetical protein